MIRTLPLALALCSRASSAQAADKPTRIPDAALKTAAQLRERALADDTAWDFIEGLTTEIGPRLAGGDNDRESARVGRREIQGARFRQGVDRARHVSEMGAPQRARAS